MDTSRETALVQDALAGNEGAISASNMPVKIQRRPTRSVWVRDLGIGSKHRISVQSMAATRTQDVAATVRQVNLLHAAGADVVRVAIDSRDDVVALEQVRAATKPARLVVDLQESYRLAEKVAPFVDKIRYNPGHLHHHEKNVPVREKVKYLVGVARAHELALRIGVNFGSLDPQQKAEQATSHAGGDSAADRLAPALASAHEHVGYLEELGFTNFVVSLKSSNPNDVVEINKRFSQMHPEVPLHLGVTEAGLLPLGAIKTRVAFEHLLALGIGDTLRASLTVPFDDKGEEVRLSKSIIEDVYAGRFRSVPKFEHSGLNIISCPSCSRVENEKFVELAQAVRAMATPFAEKHDLTIAVMGCRVNGPGETDEADLGLWCAPTHVNLKRKEEIVGKFSYEEILGRVESELKTLIANRQVKSA